MSTAAAVITLLFGLIVIFGAFALLNRPITLERFENCRIDAAEAIFAKASNSPYQVIAHQLPRWLSAYQINAIVSYLNNYLHNKCQMHPEASLVFERITPFSNGELLVSFAHTTPAQQSHLRVVSTPTYVPSSSRFLPPQYREPTLSGAALFAEARPHAA